MWWITTTPGKGPGPRGRAKYALIMSPLNPWTVVVSASIPSYMSVVYRCIISVRDLWGFKKSWDGLGLSLQEPYSSIDAAYRSNRVQSISVEVDLWLWDASILVSL